MALKSMDTQSTVLVLWTPHLRSAPLRLTPIGRSYRANHKMPIYAPSIRQCFQVLLLPLIKGAIKLYRKFGPLAVALKLRRKEWVQSLQLRSYRWRMKWKVSLPSQPSTVQRMYWRHILPVLYLSEKVRMSIEYRRVQSLVKKMFQPSLRKTAHRKSGESDDVT